VIRPEIQQSFEDFIFLSLNTCLIYRFFRKHLEISIKRSIFASTNPTTPIYDAYYGGTSLFIYKGGNI